MEIRNARVVAHRRIEPPDSLDYFPTPPWAVRALFVHVLGRRGFANLTVEEPACGEGHMAYALEDYFGTVRASDIHDYGYGAVRDFLDPVVWADIPAPDWIITNPPFAEKSLAFMRRAIARARLGVAMFVRTTQTEGQNRYRYVYRPNRPTAIAQYVERVPVHRGRWLPDGNTLTAYCWIIWRLDRRATRTDYEWIPPCRDRLLYQRDIDLFGAEDVGAGESSEDDLTEEKAS